MKLQAVDKHRVRLGEPLPFSVLDRAGNLLLARGMVVSDEDRLQRLLERGAYVNADEMHRLTESLQVAVLPYVVPARDEVAETLKSAHSQLKDLLFEPEGQADFPARVACVGATLSEVADKHPDRTLFHLIRWPTDHVLHSVTHAIQCAIASHLAAQRLRWTAGARDPLICAALTMNIAMTRLQGELAAQAEEPSDAQRADIHEHPTRGVEMLQRLQVPDGDWLRSVQEHHEAPDATGYPRAIAAIFEPAELLRNVDIFMARAIGRVSREATYPNEAMREIFLTNGRSPFIAVLIKEFGLYPPGTFVRLANDSLGIVIARGASANTPLVAEIVTKGAIILSVPTRRDTADPTYAVTSIVPSKSVVAPIDPASLYA